MPYRSNQSGDDSDPTNRPTDVEKLMLPMPKSSPTNKEFEVAIICALSLEYNAVSYLLDEFYDNGGDDEDDEADPWDREHYATGRMGKHNVVLTLLPDIGKVAAARTASCLRARFSNIRVALLVGVCGGVPKNPTRHEGDDILLGDVIVSTCIIQYDLGRQYPGGVFLRRKTVQESLGRPPKSIRSLLKLLETDRMRDRLEERTASFLVQLQQACAAKARGGRSTRYKYPGTAQDLLFCASYQHRHRVGPCCDGPAACDRAMMSLCRDIGCDETYLVKDRKELDTRRQLEREDEGASPRPAVHLGPMATSDAVMKSALERDRITGEEGVLAFETEGAGVWDDIPSIVVKGVADYADSHKNKLWQDFAAATAAAATRALLEIMQASDPPRKHASSTSSRGQMARIDNLAQDSPRSDTGGLKVSQFGPAFPNLRNTTMPFRPVLLIDARGRSIPFFLESVNCKGLLVEHLRHHFRDFGSKKIDRGDWSLEDSRTGAVFNLSRPLQELLHSGQVIIMRMDFRRHVDCYDETTQCPACGYAQQEASASRIVCNSCGVSYCRIQELRCVELPQTRKTIDIATHHPDEAGQQPLFARPTRPESHPCQGEDISRYRCVRIINMKLLRPGPDDERLKLRLRPEHVDDEECFTWELGKQYGMPPEDCKRLFRSLKKLWLLEQATEAAAALLRSRKQVQPATTSFPPPPNFKPKPTTTIREILAKKAKPRRAESQRALKPI